MLWSCFFFLFPLSTCIAIPPNPTGLPAARGCPCLSIDLLRRTELAHNSASLPLLALRSTWQQVLAPGSLDQYSVLLGEREFPPPPPLLLLSSKTRAVDEPNRRTARKLAVSDIAGGGGDGGGGWEGKERKCALPMACRRKLTAPTSAPPLPLSLPCILTSFFPQRACTKSAYDG